MFVSDFGLYRINHHQMITKQIIIADKKLDVTNRWNEWFWKISSKFCQIFLPVVSLTKVLLIVGIKIHTFWTLQYIRTYLTFVFTGHCFVSIWIACIFSLWNFCRIVYVDMFEKTETGCDLIWFENFSYYYMFNPLYLHQTFTICVHSRWI